MGLPGIKSIVCGSVALVAACACVCLCASGCSSYFDEDCDGVNRADIIMTVSHETVYLRYGPDGDGAAECILVMDEDFPGEWRPMLCGEIDGFVYERGFEYTLRVRRSVVNREDDSPEYDYQLVEVLHKEYVDE